MGAYRHCRWPSASKRSRQFVPRGSRPMSFYPSPEPLSDLPDPARVDAGPLPATSGVRQRSPGRTVDLDAENRRQSPDAPDYPPERLAEPAAVDRGTSGRASLRIATDDAGLERLGKKNFFLSLLERAHDERSHAGTVVPAGLQRSGPTWPLRERRLISAATIAAISSFIVRPSAGSTSSC